MRHKVFLSEQGVIESIFDGDINYEEMKGLLKRGYDLSFKLEDRGEKVLLLADIKEMGKATAKEITPIAVLGVKNLKFDKLAIVGARMELMLLGKVILGLAGKNSKTKFFKTRKEALKWLK